MPHNRTVLQHDGPNHLGLRCNALPEHQMALITSGCAPVRCTVMEHSIEVRNPLEIAPFSTILLPITLLGMLFPKCESDRCAHPELKLNIPP